MLYIIIGIGGCKWLVTFLRRHQSANNARIADVKLMVVLSILLKCAAAITAKDFMAKIKQIIPVPESRKYYAVFIDEGTNSGYYAERVDFIVVVKNSDYCNIVGLLGDMELADIADDYYGTYSEYVLRNELSELWEEMISDLQNELSPWEQIIAHSATGFIHKANR